MNKTISQSRTYVAICSKTGFDGYYFKKFYLPESQETKLNNSEVASWYFLNRLDLTACIDGCFTFEDFSNVKSVPQKFISPDIYVSLVMADLMSKTAEEIDVSSKKFADEMSKNFSEELEKAKWEKAINYLTEMINAYQGIVGMKNVNPYLALAFLDSLLKRYNNGDRTEELYKAIMSCE